MRKEVDTYVSIYDIRLYELCVCIYDRCIRVLYTQGDNINAPNKKRNIPPKIAETYQN